MVTVSPATGLPYRSVTMAVAVLVAVWLATIEVGDERDVDAAAAAALHRPRWPLVPVMVPVTVSVAVTVRLPAVFRVTLTVRVAGARARGPCRRAATAAPSVLVKWTVPA